MHKRVEVIHCAETIKGGVASYLRELLPLQVFDFGWGCVVLLIPASQQDDLPSIPGVRFETFNDKGYRFFVAFRLAIKLLMLVRLYSPRVLHIHSTFAGASVRPLFAIINRSVKVVYCPHGWAWDRSMSKFGKFLTCFLERGFAHITDKIVCISEYERRTAIEVGLPENKLIVVRNAISLTSPIASPIFDSVWPESVRRVLFIGRFDRQKGFDILLEALTLLGGSVHAVIAGAPVRGDEVERKIPVNATCVGWVSPNILETLLQNAQILVVPSRWEGFGLVALEAMRSGVPVIASSVGGLPEVVDHDVTGIVIKPCSPVALANAILSRTDLQLRDMGKMGRKRVRDFFSIDRLHEELCVVYESELSRNKKILKKH
ncbi:glycosyltransferase family 4 protein [Quatrionicoccus australiensis]|uniref:glycosyltransferase family 4 protein n=1 Tax=Quatrionicoccus australiensis TaxID=138118 RepID=UPI001CF847F8|nr:glycosyltransferase family 4 protein [Quatrionicoccus australiensis]UCV13944.1 glycosyltransferase family 4 protein [Quatrionicoccus australiensis]